MPIVYEEPTKIEIDQKVAIKIFEKLHCHNDTPWAAASFCQPQKGNLQVVMDF